MSFRSVGRYLARHHVALLALFVALGGTAAAVVGAGGGNREIRACVKKANGKLRIVGKKELCRSSERRLTWNRVGRAGPTGPTGATGPSGSVATPDGWHLVGAPGEPGFSPPWQAVPATPLGFRKDAEGQVLLKGQASPAGAWGNYVFVLPPGYRPSAEINLPVVSDTLPARMVIEPDGQVVPTTPTGGYTRNAFFDGMSFPGG
jgi:hypothetical protein